MAVLRIALAGVASMLAGAALAQGAATQPVAAPLRFTLNGPPVHNANSGFAPSPLSRSFIVQTPAAPAPAVSQAAPAAGATPAPQAVTGGTPGELAGSCLPTPRQMPAERVSALMRNPRLLLEQFSYGGGGLSGEIRSAIATAPELVEPVLSLIESANINQKSAIGVGLATAALACVEKRPDIAGLIQARLLALGERDVLTAFNTASGTTVTAATTTGIGGAPPGGGPGPTLGTGDSIGAYGNGGVAFSGADTSRRNLFSSVLGSASDSLTSTRTIGGGSVSPTRP